MDVESFREYCLNKPHVTEGTPFGEDVLVFKVAGKMFGLVSLDEFPAGDLADYFDSVLQGAVNPSASPWVLQPDGSLVAGGAIEAEKAGPPRSMADDSYSQL